MNVKSKLAKRHELVAVAAGVPLPPPIRHGCGRPTKLKNIKQSKPLLGCPVFQDGNSAPTFCQYDIQLSITVEVDRNRTSLLTK